jgi:hypothetical protein
LKLSYKWEFEDLSLTAVTQLNKEFAKECNCIKSIILGRKFSVWRWVLGGYTKLAARVQPLTSAEMQAIGFDAAAEIASIREEVASLRVAPIYPPSMHARPFYSGIQNFDPMSSRTPSPPSDISMEKARTEVINKFRYELQALGAGTEDLGPEA